MNRIILSLTLILAAPAFGQTLYKCPDPSGVVKFQQMPCSPTGGGEAMTISIPKPSADGGLRASEQAYMQSRDQYWGEKAKADTAENQRQEALDAENRKARAAEEQAAAQRATAAAIWATGVRRW
jgi:hypothetical protein